MRDEDGRQGEGEGKRYRLRIVIVSWNVDDDLRVCLRSVFAGSRQDDYEVWVIDNASSDGTVAMVREEFPQVRLVCNEENRGFAAANNQGLADADADYCLLLNPDTLVPEGGLGALADFAEMHPKAGVIGAKLVNPDGSLQYSARRFPTVRAAIFRNTAFGRWFPGAHSPQEYLMTDWDHNDARVVDWISGACMLIRREALEAIGELDEGFFWGSEDVDYCFRARSAGWQVMYTPEPTIVHAIGRSTSQAVVQTIVRTHYGMQRLYRKHLARKPMTRSLVFIGVWLRAGLLICSHCVRLAIARMRSLLRRG